MPVGQMAIGFVWPEQLGLVGRMGVTALSESDAVVIVSTAGGAALVALIGFLVWWSKPFRANRANDPAPSFRGDDDLELDD